MNTLFFSFSKPIKWQNSLSNNIFTKKLMNFSGCRDRHSGRKELEIFFFRVLTCLDMHKFI